MVKEGDTVYTSDEAPSKTPRKKYDKIAPHISDEQNNNFQEFSDLVVEILKKTLAHQHKANVSPDIHHKFSSNGVNEAQTTISSIGVLASVSTFRGVNSDIRFYMVQDKVRVQSILFNSDAKSLNVPFNAEMIIDLPELVQNEKSLNQIVDFVTHICEGRKEELKPFALDALKAAIEKKLPKKQIEAPEPTKPETAKPSHIQKDFIKRDLEAFGKATSQAIQNTLNDLGIPRKTFAQFQALTSNEIIVAFQAGVKMRFVGFKSTQFRYAVKFNTDPNTELGNSKYRHGPKNDHAWIYDCADVPFLSDHNSIVDSIDAQAIDFISQNIAKKIRIVFGQYLDTSNLKVNQELETIFAEHLLYALAAIFGNELSLGNKNLELTQFDEEEANTQFRDEMKQLTKAKRVDHYLLQTFGMAAGNKAGEDAAIISEWQIGRTLRLPTSLEKIRHIHDTLASFVDMDVQSRAKQASELLSAMRSLQKTITRDNKILSDEAKSIHGAKSIMRAHEEMLQKYVQGFTAIRDNLSETFGEAATQKREDALATNLAAVQIHTSNQESIHERLNLRMMEQISDFSTHLSFLAKSMQEIVDKAAVASLLSDRQTIEDITPSALSEAGIRGASVKSLQGMDRSEIEQSTHQLIEDLRQELAPLTLEIKDIEEQLVLADEREERLRITDQSTRIHDID